ncbi:Alpha/Beta hydrolase protein [Globomyces pollinis-pini]|nr:Alpha/Beta hydrolase protein [Globomyces pollinis-pini]
MKPIVFWHGMGDSCCGNLEALSNKLKEDHPGLIVHSIRIGETEDQDRKASFFDLINRQVDEVCEDFQNNPDLKNGFNAMGFSQGGLFLRAYVQRCNNPPIHNLITFGSPHAGTADIPNCQNSSDLNCALMRSVVKNGVYWSWVQNRIVQAQYYKNPNNLDTYLSSSIFLPDINDELEVINVNYAKRMKSLEKLVLIRFLEDKMIIPKDSAWFSFYDQEGNVIPLAERGIYSLILF